MSDVKKEIRKENEAIVKQKHEKAQKDEAISKELIEKGIEPIKATPKQIEQAEKDIDDAPILKLLEEPELNTQYLDLGETPTGLWYYGFNLRGKEAIITSQQRILRNTEEHWKGKVIGENEIRKIIEYEGYIGDIAPTMKRETIKRYYQKTKDTKLINPKKLYKAIREKILYYMDFSGEDEISDVLTSWIIATYCYPLFYWFPHILINAPSGSGKSKCGYILTQLSFRGYDLGASAGVTPAQIFRTIEGNRGTILIDEFELRKGQVASDTQQLVNQIINASATRDAYVIRTEQINKKWRAWKFPIYCPKIVCNISGINPTSLSRFIAFKWLKTSSEKGKRKPYREKDKQNFIPLRENTYIFMLENWRDIKETSDTIHLELSNRVEDNWIPLFTIARYIDKCEGEDVNAEEQLQKYLNNYQELSIDTGDPTGEFFNILYELVEEKARYYQPKEIGEWEDIKDVVPGYIKRPANWIGKRLTLYKFKDVISGGIKKYWLSKENIKEVLNLYFAQSKPYITTQTLHNDTNTTKPLQKVGFSGVCVVMPKPKVEEISVKKEDIGG